MCTCSNAALITDANHNTLEAMPGINDMVAIHRDGDGNVSDIAFIFPAAPILYIKPSTGTKSLGGHLFVAIQRPGA